jgi:predicted amidohydrolase
VQDLRIAMVQMNSRVAEHERNLATIARFTEQAAAQDVDIVCFPELCVCGYSVGDPSTLEPEPLRGDSLRRLEVISGDHEITVLAGFLERDVSGIVYNTQVICGPQGYVGHYRKTHVPDVEIGTFCHGDALPVFEHAKARYGIEICYDSHFPEVSTILAGKGAEVIFLPHASPGETREEKRTRWMRFIPARAYDNGVFVAVCNPVGDNGAGRVATGVTFVCDPSGVVIDELDSGTEEGMIVTDLLTSSMAGSRKEATMFFRHFRRPEMYRRWESE